MESPIHSPALQVPVTHSPSCFMEFDGNDEQRFSDLGTTTDLGEPMQTIGRVKKVDGAVREEPSMERAWHSGDETLSRHPFLFLLNPLVESRQGLENGVEIILWKIIQEDLKGGWLTAEPTASCTDAVYDLPQWQEGVGS